MLTITTKQTSTDKVEEMSTLTIVASKLFQKGDNLRLPIYDLVIFFSNPLEYRNTKPLCFFNTPSKTSAERRATTVSSGREEI